ncbi:hypothetical protein E4U43_006904 [Claviceps pusilla]|uniref:Uncharacterized protein n=1 Tax=Claviceps pusilla TaxID=123648 RepID=A0A9P7NDC7_9HYPO|nr:hypothetical protein E4U43_006904 [Claviceps pusilla]
MIESTGARVSIVASGGAELTRTESGCWRLCQLWSGAEGQAAGRAGRAGAVAGRADRGEAGSRWQSLAARQNLGAPCEWLAGQSCRAPESSLHCEVQIPESRFQTADCRHQARTGT